MNELDRQLEISISLKHGKHVISMITWLNSPCFDRIHGVCCKQLTTCYGRISGEIPELLENGAVPEWLMVVKTVFTMKVAEKGRITNNFRLAACLPLMWKLPTGIFAWIYDHILQDSLLSDKEKTCRKKSRGTKDRLLIDKAVLGNCRRASNRAAVS